MRTRVSMLLLCASASVAGLFAAIPVHAAIYRVGSGAGCTHSSIQAAIGAAAVSPESDEIRLSATLTYTQQSLLIDQVKGSLVIAGGFVTCMDNAQTAGARTVIDGTGTLPVVRIYDTRTVVLNRLDLQGGNAGRGGGVSATGRADDVLMLSGTLVRSNQAVQGGGIAIDSLDGGRPYLLLFGDSSVTSNSAVNGTGAGIYCRQASVQIFDTSFVALNSASFDGGGIYADKCEVQFSTRGLAGAAVWGNVSGTRGGGVFATGAQSHITLITVDANTPARIAGNEAAYGGGVALVDGADMQAYDAVLEQNTALRGGGAVMVEATAQATDDTRFTMTASADGAPGAFVPCADVEACNRMTANRVIDTANERGPGAVAYVNAVLPLAHVRFDGTRLERNTGTSLTRHTANFGQVVFDGAVLVDNKVAGPLLDAPGSSNSLVVVASTIAANELGAGRGVIRGAGSCAPEDDVRGTYASLDIVWQPGNALLEPLSALVSGCFLYLAANDFGALPADPRRLSVDPLFRDSGNGDYRLSLGSPLLDFAPAAPMTFTRSRTGRVVDVSFAINRFGPQDLGAYEYFEDHIFSSGFEDGNASAYQ